MSSNKHTNTFKELYKQKVPNPRSNRYTYYLINYINYKVGGQLLPIKQHTN